MNTKIRANTNRRMKTEILSWKQNKMEAKKLERMHEQVDKHMVNKRKTHLFEKDLLNKDITETISKTTPTADEYLDRSYRRYAGWRAREKDRLDRRYKGLYKTYLREFSDLGIDEETLNKARKKHATSQDSKATSKDSKETKEVESTNVEEEEDETDAQTELLDFSKLKLNQRRRFSIATTSSQYVPAADDMVRRRSTGNALPLEVLENLRRSSLPLLNEKTPLTDSDTADARPSTPGTEKADQNKTEVSDGQAVSDKSRRGRRASLAVTSDLADSKELQNIVNPGRRGRRASLAVTSNIDSSGEIQPLNIPGRKGRRASVTANPEGAPIQTAAGARLSRRSSIPNIEIPMMYGN